MQLINKIYILAYILYASGINFGLGNTLNFIMAFGALVLHQLNRIKDDTTSILFGIFFLINLIYLSLFDLQFLGKIEFLDAFRAIFFLIISYVVASISIQKNLEQYIVRCLIAFILLNFIATISYFFVPYDQIISFKLSISSYGNERYEDYYFGDADYASGLYSYVHVAAFYIFLKVVLIWYLINIIKNKYEITYSKYLLAFITAVGFLTIIFLGQRAAFLYYLFFILMVISINQKNILYYTYIGIFSVVLLMLIINVSILLPDSAFANQANRLFNPGSWVGSDDVRIQSWIFAWENFNQNPFFGNQQDEFYFAIHNIWLSLLSSYGLFGSIFSFIIAYYLLYLIYHSSRSVIRICIIFAFLLNSFTHTLSMFENDILIFLVFFILIKYRDLEIGMKHAKT